MKNFLIIKTVTEKHIVNVEYEIKKFSEFCDKDGNSIIIADVVDNSKVSVKVEDMKENEKQENLFSGL